eukprot:CAMPEP_0182491128 /NCGR_PEP_ID=MMETSP1321-20130603/714_1 /TAXON_ID=91990 /ORGANISM="Bolidomonas sp., Strain RCC1657" /LENGTH=394 /DNA_ID=CAMNT_0024693385 /DNA_START=245 /DNA_END=1429 /DNA_ORIENTATION=+
MSHEIMSHEIIDQDTGLDLLLNYDRPPPKSRLRQLMEKVAHFLAVSTFLSLLVLIPVITVQALKDKNTSNDHVAFYSSACFVGLTMPISIYGIYGHLSNYNQPKIQKYVVRILWMVPLYSLQSWLGLRFHDSSVWIESLRDMYESYTLASFLYYLIEVLGGEEEITRTLLDMPEQTYGKHGRFMSLFFTDWSGSLFLGRCKWGVLQYVVVKVFCVFLTILCEAAGTYGNGEFSLTSGYFYVTFVANVSQCLALYVLVKLFYAVKVSLLAIGAKPYGKFACVKGVVFFTWWQGVGIAVLQNYGIIHERGTWSQDDVADGLQDYLITVEMLFFAVAHMYTFSYTEYCVDEDLGLPRSGGTFGEALWSSSVPSEIGEDIKTEVLGRKKKEDTSVLSI